MTTVNNGADKKQDYVQNQIFRRDGKNCFFELTNSAYTINKQQWIFANYDPNQDNKQTTNISIYMDVEEMKNLSQDILSGRIHALGQKASKIAEEETKKAGKNVYAKPVYESMGGVTLERFKKQGKKYSFDVPEGFCISRIFRITPGAKADWMLTAQIGLGKEDKNGLIVPQGMPKEIVRIPMSNKDLKQLAIISDAHINGYITAQYQAANEVKMTDAQLQAIIMSVTTMLKTSLSDDVKTAVTEVLAEHAEKRAKAQAKPQQTRIEQ